MQSFKAFLPPQPPFLVLWCRWGDGRRTKCSWRSRSPWSWCSTFPSTPLRPTGSSSNSSTSTCSRSSEYQNACSVSAVGREERDTERCCTVVHRGTVLDWELSSGTVQCSFPGCTSWLLARSLSSHIFQLLAFEGEWGWARCLISDFQPEPTAQWGRACGQKPAACACPSWGVQAGCTPLPSLHGNGSTHGTISNVFSRLSIWPSCWQYIGLGLSQVLGPHCSASLIHWRAGVSVVQQYFRLFS